MTNDYHKSRTNAPQQGARFKAAGPRTLQYRGEAP